MLKVAQFIFVLVLTGCASYPQVPRDYGIYAKTYDSACSPKASLRVEVAPPRCIGDMFEMNEGFESSFEFNVCRASVTNFVSALDTFRYCKISSATNKFNEVIKRTEEQIDCYEKQLDALDNDIVPSGDCGPLNVPKTFYMDVHFPILNFGSVMVVHDFDIPGCAKDKLQFNPEKRWVFAFEVRECKEDLEDYLTTTWSSPSAQRDKYINDLNLRISSYKEKAMKVFNCKAERGGRCEYEWD